MFGIGGFELVIIIVFAFLIFGPDKLPGVIKNVTHIWETLKGLREQADQVIKAEVVEPLKDIEATVNPFVEQGKSATDMLAKRLGIKPDTPNKDDKKLSADQSDTKSDDSKDEAAEAQSAEVEEAAGEKAAETQSTKPTKGSAQDGAAPTAEPVEKPKSKSESKPKPEPKPKPKPKPKTESFAEKKAALERAHREKQSVSEDAGTAAASSEPSKKLSDSDEMAGE